jgi:hypothetical protein
VALSGAFTGSGGSPSPASRRNPRLQGGSGDGDAGVLPGWRRGQSTLRGTGSRVVAVVGRGRLGVVVFVELLQRRAPVKFRRWSGQCGRGMVRGEAEERGECDGVLNGGQGAPLL